MEKTKNFNPWEGVKVGISKALPYKKHMLVDFKYLFWGEYFELEI